MTDYRGISFSHDTGLDDLAPKAPLAGDRDVATMGGGLTGM